MIKMLLPWLTALAALGNGLMAGFFFAFSAVTMKALGRLPPEQGVAAMRSINVVVPDPWFFTAFFGTAAVSLILAACALLDWNMPGAIYLLGGSVLYLVGVVVVTIAFNVPLNDALAAVEPNGAAAAELWARYLSVWTAWNHVQTVAPLLGAAALMVALRHQA